MRFKRFKNLQNPSHPRDFFGRLTIFAIPEGGKARETEIPEGAKPPRPSRGQGTGNGDSGWGFDPPDPPTTTFHKRRLRLRRSSTQRSAEKNFGRKIRRPYRRRRKQWGGSGGDAGPLWPVRPYERPSQVSPSVGLEIGSVQSILHGGVWSFVHTLMLRVSEVSSAGIETAGV